MCQPDNAFGSSNWDEGTELGAERFRCHTEFSTCRRRRTRRRCKVDNVSNQFFEKEEPKYDMKALTSGIITGLGVAASVFAGPLAPFVLAGTAVVAGIAAAATPRLPDGIDYRAYDRCESATDPQVLVNCMEWKLSTTAVFNTDDTSD